MKVLHLTIKKKWFDMIVSGEKKEEYREIKPYWVSRLVNELIPPRQAFKDFEFEYAGFKHIMGSAQHYDAVKFTNGYKQDSPTITLKIRDIVQGYGKEEWGAEFNKPYFVIKLGEVIKK